MISSPGVRRIATNIFARGRIGQCAGQNQLAARIRFACHAKMFVAIRRAPGDEIIDHVVHEREIRHRNSSPPEKLQRSTNGRNKFRAEEFDRTWSESSAEELRSAAGDRG